MLSDVDEITVCVFSVTRLSRSRLYEEVELVDSCAYDAFAMAINSTMMKAVLANEVIGNGR